MRRHRFAIGMAVAALLVAAAIFYGDVLERWLLALHGVHRP